MRVPSLRKAYCGELQIKRAKRLLERCSKMKKEELEEILVDPARGEQQVKADAIATAIEDIKPYVDPDDPMVAQLNDLLAQASWEDGGVPTASQIEGLPEAKSCKLRTENDDETASSIYGDGEDREILLDQEPPTIGIGKTGASMTPLSPMEVIVLKVKDDGAGDSPCGCPSCSGGGKEYAGRVGAPGGPNLEQPSSSCCAADKELEEGDVIKSMGGPGRQVGGPVLA